MKQFICLGGGFFRFHTTDVTSQYAQPWQFQIFGIKSSILVCPSQTSSPSFTLLCVSNTKICFQRNKYQPGTSVSAGITSPRIFPKLAEVSTFLTPSELCIYNKKIPFRIRKKCVSQRFQIQSSQVLNSFTVIRQKDDLSLVTRSLLRRDLSSEFCHSTRRHHGQNTTMVMKNPIQPKQKLKEASLLCHLSLS